MAGDTETKEQTCGWSLFQKEQMWAFNMFKYKFALYLWIKQIVVFPSFCHTKSTHWFRRNSSMVVSNVFQWHLQVLFMRFVMRPQLGRSRKKGKTQKSILESKLHRVFLNSSARTKSTNKNGWMEFKIYCIEPVSWKMLSILWGFYALTRAFDCLFANNFSVSYVKFSW